MQYFLMALLAVLASPLMAATAHEPLSLARVFADPPLLGTLPRAARISPDGKWLAYLKPRADDQLRHDLWIEPVAGGRALMVADSLAMSAGGAVSEAELMRRERARLAASRGIVEYQWAPDGQSLLVPLDGDLWLVPLAGAARRLTETQATEIDAKISPRGRYVSFVRDQNLFVLDLDGKREQALTREGGGLISYGVAEFVAQEEMDRMTGQWWSPDDRRIVIARVDETPVKVAVRAAIGATGTRVTEQRYPFAGTPNALVSLAIHRPDDGKVVQVDLGDDPDFYLARVNWLNDRQVLVQRQSRDQKRLDVLLIEADTGKARLLFSETSASWVRLHDSLKPLRDGRRFLWASARSGYRHLYLFDPDATDGLRQLTHGAFDISELLAVDEEAGTLLFSGFRETPLEKAVYRQSLSGGEPKRLTAMGGWTEAVADDRGRAMLLTRSTPSQPPVMELLTDTQSRVLTSPDTPYASRLNDHLAPTFGTLKAADGVTDLHYALTMPRSRKPGALVPVFMEIYAGPGVQRVRHAFGSLLHQYLLQRGWAIFQVDGRGTPSRGEAFEDAIYRRLGYPEVDDQIAALQWLKGQPGIDGAKVAVYGWSYGGYMAQRLLTEHPGAFAAGVSGAPVTDWRLYDTHYTERYLGNPITDPAPYDAAAISAVGRLADPLLLIHGLADDNVVFDHSARVMALYQQAGKMFDTMVYPGQTHGIREPAMARHLWETITRFLDREVLKEQGAVN